MSHIEPSQDIQSRIYRIRGKQVMLDRDLAVLYGLKAIALRQQVSRNLERFPSDFHVSINPFGGRMVGITKCDTLSRRHLGMRIPALCFYGKRSCNAIRRS